MDCFSSYTTNCSEGAREGGKVDGGRGREREGEGGREGGREDVRGT